ncbi:glycosyltransferase family 4 protein [Saccharothrix deserti]|uniref:glycosyltransferase family 4 protein n=1 Tax=Saccharothrix deserti TaxID=2593674 RepID=UPI00131C45AB|nr:glycosyltransferase family 4 protein [Saccharothrix deserti]
MTHPRRRRLAELLVEAHPDLHIEIVSDPEPDGPPGSFRTARRAWSAIPPDATHHLVLQDDVELCANFASAVRTVIAARSGDAISLFTEWGSRTSHGLRIAALTGRAWAPVTDTYAPSQGLVLPADAARGAEHHLTRAEAEALPDDQALLGYLDDIDLRCYAVLPNLVEHHDTASLVGNTAMGPRPSVCYFPDGPARDEAEQLADGTATTVDDFVPYFSWTEATAYFCVRNGSDRSPRKRLPAAEVFRQRRIDPRAVAQACTDVVERGDGELREHINPILLHQLWLVAVGHGLRIAETNGGTLLPPSSRVAHRALGTLAPGALRRFLPPKHMDRLRQALTPFVWAGMRHGADLHPVTGPTRRQPTSVASTSPGRNADQTAAQPRPDPTSGRTALVVATDPRTAVGGVALRLRALEAALAGDSPPVTVVLACDQRRRCRHQCWVDATERTPHDGPYYLARRCGEYVRWLADHLARMDVTTVICSELDCYGIIPDLVDDGRFRVICDMHNVESALVQDLVAVGSGPHGRGQIAVDEISQLERAVVETAHQVWVPSANDRASLLRRYTVRHDLDVQVVPNAVAVGPAPEAAGSMCRVTFTGRLDYLPNRLAAEFLAHEVVPTLRRHGVDLPVVVAGANPDAELAQRLKDANVRLVANPVSTHDLIRDSVLVLPLQLGGGSRLKVLEAFALGAPVVSTRKGVEGLDVRAGEHFLDAESADDIARAVAAVAGNPDLRHRLVDTARRLVERRYSVEALTTHVAGLLADTERTATRGEAVNG